MQIRIQLRLLTNQKNIIRIRIRILKIKNSCILLSNQVIKPKSESESESKNSKIYNPNPTKKPDNPDFEIRLRIRCTPLVRFTVGKSEVYSPVQCYQNNLKNGIHSFPARHLVFKGSLWRTSRQVRLLCS